MTTHEESTGSSKIEYVNAIIEAKPCSVYEDIISGNPILRIMTVLITLIMVVLFFCLLCICKSYCRLETSYNELEMQVRQQQQEVGLPEDYEYEEDNIYMEHLREEEIRLTGASSLRKRTRFEEGEPELSD